MCQCFIVALEVLTSGSSGNILYDIATSICTRAQRVSFKKQDLNIWFLLGLPDVRQKVDISSFLKSCPPSGRHWLYMEKCPAVLSVTDLPTLLVAMAQYHLCCVYRFNRKLSQRNSSHKVQSEETVLRRVSLRMFLRTMSCCAKLHLLKKYETSD